MGVIFDGKQFSEEILGQLLKLPEMSRKKVLAVLLDSHNESGVKYVAMKKRVAQRLGVQMDVYEQELDFLSAVADGKMVQLPFLGSNQIVEKFLPDQDVDGMQEESVYLPATVRAILKILDQAVLITQRSADDLNIVVVGVWGTVGSKVANELGKRHTVVGMDKEDFSVKEIRDADVIISATGQEGLILPDMVSDGAICIDVGYPQGDFVSEVNSKSSFFTPVPGGVGPVTVACLFENLLLGHVLPGK